MKKLVLKPIDFPCKLSECPPGLFLSPHNTVCMMSEYSQEAYNNGGERYHGKDDKVTPLIAVWEEV